MGEAHDERLLKEAERLAAELAERSAEIEAARRLPSAFARSFDTAGFFRLCLPRSLGGPEVHPALLVRAIERLAIGDGSAAWCAMIAATTSALAAWLEPGAARAIFAAPGAIVGGVFAPSGRARRVAGGFSASGRWSFASGCQHSTHLLGGCLVEEDAGPTASAKPARRPDVRLLFLPVDSIEIQDTWQVAGLCGTGSHHIAVRDLYVPEAHSVSIQSGAPREPGALYRFPIFGLLAIGVASVSLGIARRALDELRALAVRKTPALSQRRLAERGAVQARVAEAEGLLGGGRAGLLSTIDEVWRQAAAGGAMGVAERARMRVAASHAVQAATRAVDIAWELCGGSAIYLDGPLQRLFRDAHVITQHASVSGGSLELAGRALLGVDGDTSIL